MKRLVWTLLITSMLVLSACSGGTGTTPTALPTVVLNTTQSNGSSASTITASANIVPAAHAQLSFSLSGRVTNVAVKVGDQVHAGDILATLDSVSLSAQVASAKGALQSAQADLDLLKRFGEIRERISAAEGRVAQAQAALDIANANLASATLTAPFDGTVAEVRVVAGENAAPGQAVLVLGDLSRFIIETTDLSERDVTRIKLGQSATIFVEALNSNIDAKVIAISPLASTLGGDVVYKVTLELNDQPAGLMWGMSAEVTITIE